MGKKRKTTEKLLAFYRGPITKPPRVATEDEVKLIFEALKDCCQFNRRNNSYQFPWLTLEPIPLRLVLGLGASLRCLKQGRTLAIICDEKLTPHVIKFLVDFANKQSLPLIQTNRLSEIAPKLEINTSLSVVSIVKEVTGNEKVYQNPKNPKPNPAAQQLVSKPFDRLCKLLLSSLDTPQPKTLFKLPHQEKIKPTGKSKVKKEARRELKSAKLKHTEVNKSTCDEKVTES